LSPATLPPVLGQQNDPLLISQAIRGVIQYSTSLRGVAGWLAMMTGKVLGHDTIRNWLLRLGYHLLHRSNAVTTG
jgi:hypothetical protein